MHKSFQISKKRYLVDIKERYDIERQEKITYTQVIHMVWHFFNFFPIMELSKRVPQLTVKISKLMIL